MYSFLLFFPLSPLSPSTLSLFSSPALHHITPPPQLIRLQPPLIPHIVSTPHTKVPPLLLFSLFLYLPRASWPRWVCVGVLGGLGVCVCWVGSPDRCCCTSTR